MSRGYVSGRDVEREGCRHRVGELSYAPERETRGNRRHLTRDERDFCRAAGSPQLRCDRRPGRVGIRSLAVEAVQARTLPRLDDRADPNARVAEYDGQVRDVAPQPQAVELRIENVVGDGDREWHRA